MSFDLAIWRRSAATKTAMLADAYEKLGHEDHPAADMFDAHEFVQAAASAHGRLSISDTELTWISIDTPTVGSVAVSLCPWMGSTSAVVDVTGPFDALEATIAAVVPLVIERDLLLYDPQSLVVYNNRRSYPER